MSLLNVPWNTWGATLTQFCFIFFSSARLQRRAYINCGNCSMTALSLSRRNTTSFPTINIVALDFPAQNYLSRCHELVGTLHSSRTMKQTSELIDFVLNRNQLLQLYSYTVFLLSICFFATPWKAIA